MRRVRSPKRRVRDDDFMVGSCSDYPRIVFLLAEAIQGCSVDILNSEFHGRRSIWWCWMDTSVAPRIVNDVSYVRSCYHESDFAWQAQYYCCSWRVTLVAPRIVNDVSYLMRRSIWWSWIVIPVAPRIVKRGSIITVILRGRCSIWWSWRMTPVAPRNVNNGSYVSRINHECCFVVQSSTGVVFCSTE